MKRFFFFLSFWMVALSVFSQVVTTRPAVPLESGEVTIVFHADEGSKGLMDFAGDVYAHTGVITDQSADGTDWKYTISDWGVNVPKAKMTRVDENTYELTVSPDVRFFYEVPEGEELLKMAFVFRSATEINGGWKEGKEIGGKDIFVPLYKAGVTAVFSAPANNALVDPGETVVVQGQSADATQTLLLLDGMEVASTSQSVLNYSFSAPASGRHELVLKALADAGEASDTVRFFVREAVEEVARPEGLRNGVNVIDDHTVTLVLQAPEKAFVYVVGDFNDWEPRPEAQMKKDGEYFWLTLSDLDAGVEYAYQYFIDGEIFVADPYANKVLDPWHDKDIPDRIYPNLKPYPTGKADGIVSVFNSVPDDYQWKTGAFIPPSPEKMVVYEILIRDFTANQDIKTITDTLSYLKRLGINAIELMPFNEFEGNDSWGYNPSFYFATDKAYGTLNDYKTFVDSCHSKGIAVIMDLVLNHSYGQSPLVQMYFEDGKPATNNPWYNRDHNMKNPNAQWGYDFNHESDATKGLIDSINSYWMSELHVDGFRFDFTKGFTNTEYGYDSWGSDYDPSRIAILKRMTNEIRRRNARAVVIFEHLSENREEKELSEDDILLWGNVNYNFSEAVMGYNENGKSDFGWASYQQRGWDQPHVLAYMESHDEERVMYKALAYGNSAGSYDVKHPAVSLSRAAMAGVFLMSIPGPKMVWQFGEMGYDVSIEDGGRLSQKPPRWNYLQEADREALRSIYSKIIHLKTNEAVFSTSNFQLEVHDALKKISLNGETEDIRLIGNFGVTSGEVIPSFSSAGWWYNYFQGDSLLVSDPQMSVILEAGEFALYSSKKLKGFDGVTAIMPGDIEPLGVLAFPNPVVDYLNFSGREAVQRLVLYDSLGRMVFEKELDGIQRVNLSFIKPGVYLVRVSLRGNKSGVFKMIKN